ncbi:MAG: AIPR family protein [Pyrinomonadaceae bacterium]
MTKLNLNYPQLLDLFTEHIVPNRSESASFLIWYLENYYRLDSVEAVDSVCDQSNDKGVDGIFVNDNDMTITIFQSKIAQKSAATIGDSSLRTFAGTLSQFETAEKIENIIATGAAQLASLAKRLNLVTKISTHELRGEFLCNVEIDANGSDFLRTEPRITFVGRTTLEDTYISDKRDLPVHKNINFDIIGFSVAEYTVDADIKAVIAPVKATELVTMEGIANQSLFAYNVRGSLGKTGVNKEIRDSIKDQSLHKKFPLFHNGITVIAKQLELTNESISVGDYFVVNGCQSLTALYNGKTSLTDNLRVLTKFIKLEPKSSLAKTITEFSNNQNGVKDRDFRANEPKQIRLQNEFKDKYAGTYSFEIKRGEIKGSGKVISNEEAGLLLMAFDLKEPWATHRTYQVFEDKYSQIFGHKDVTADRIVLVRVIAEAIDAALPHIKNVAVARYKLTRYMMVYIVRNILESDELARDILTKPQKFVRDENDRNRFRSSIAGIVEDIVVDLNAELEEAGEDFAYRDKLREEEWVRDLTRGIVADYTKLVRRGRIQSFGVEWQASTAGS